MIPQSKYAHMLWWAIMPSSFCLLPFCCSYMQMHVENQSFFSYIAAIYRSTQLENSKETAARSTKMKKNKSTKRTNHIPCSSHQHDAQLHLERTAPSGFSTYGVGKPFLWCRSINQALVFSLGHTWCSSIVPAVVSHSNPSQSDTKWSLQKHHFVFQKCSYVPDLW